MKVLVLLCVAYVSAYQISYDSQPAQVIYEQQPGQVIYEQQPAQVVYEQRPQQVVYQQQPQVVYQPQQQPAMVAKKCPIACPYGWNKWGPFTKNCYLMPSQPLKLDTFWNQYHYCKSKEPTSYPLVVNDLVEQALATGVALQYTPSYFLQLTNAHVWLGAWTDPNGNWVVADGSKPNGVLMLPAKVGEIVGGSRNGSCLSADPKTLGAWLPRPCNDDTGVVFCEMAQRPVCDGRTGGLLPLGDIDLKDSSKLIPKNPSIPLFGQLLGGGSLLGLGGDRQGGLLG